jgi:putative transposase
MNQYNSHIHNRQSTRLKGYDYSKAGAYFITICTRNHECLFGKIMDGKMVLNEYGTIAHNEWTKLSERFPNVELDVFQIMPNHIHGIIVLNDVRAGFTPAPIDPTRNSVGATLAVAHDDNPVAHDDNAQNNKGQPQGLPLQQQPSHMGGDNRATARVAPTTTVGDMIGAYKSLVANKCLEIYKTKNEIMGKLWQRNYHDHIIRNAQSYETISNYIINNPIKWNEDKFYR